MSQQAYLKCVRVCSQIHSSQLLSYFYPLIACTKHMLDPAHRDSTKVMSKFETFRYGDETKIFCANPKFSKRKRSQDSEKASRQNSRQQDVRNLAKILRETHVWKDYSILLFDGGFAFMIERQG